MNAEAHRRLIVNESEDLFAARYGMEDPIELKPGEYMGPYKGTVWARLPEPNGQLLRVCEPPWVFRECPDFSLEIRESIWFDKGGEHDWHGFLDEGYIWRQL